MRTASLMVGLGIFMVAMTLKFLPSVWTATYRENTVCHITQAEIVEELGTQKYVIMLDLRWTVGSVAYGTGAPQQWRESPIKSSTLAYLQATYATGVRHRCYYDAGVPTQVYPEKARPGELMLMIVMGLLGLGLLVVGAIRLKRFIRRPSRYRASVTEGATYHYVAQSPRPPGGGTSAAKVWGPVFEAWGLVRPDPAVFRFEGTLQGVSVHAFLAELDETMERMGIFRPPLTLLFDHPEGVRDVFFWVRPRATDEPIDTSRQFWASFDLVTDRGVEIIGYDEVMVASLLDAHGRSLIARLTVDRSITLYAGHQKTTALDTLLSLSEEEGLALLKDWVEWMHHVFYGAESPEERLSAIAISDPDPLVRLHRLCLLNARFPDRPVTRKTNAEGVNSAFEEVAATAKFLGGDASQGDAAARLIARSIQTLWTAEGVQHKLVQAMLHQFMDALPPSLDARLIAALLNLASASLSRDLLKLLQRRPELSRAAERALLKGLPTAAFPLALQTIQLLGHRGGLDALEPIGSFTRGEHQHTDLSEAAAAACRNINRRHELLGEPSSSP